MGAIWLNNIRPEGVHMFGVQPILVVCFVFLACRSRQASIVLERYFRFEVSLLSILCMLWRWEPVEYRAIPILLRKLPNISYIYVFTRTMI